MVAASFIDWGSILEQMTSLFPEERSWGGQLLILISMAACMQVYIPWATGKVMEWMSKHPMREQYIDINQSTAQNSFGVKISRSLAFELGCWTVVVLTQHMVGGLLCLPSILQSPWISQKNSAMFVRLGGLTETGYEFQDLSSRLYAFNFGGEEGRKKNPVAGLMILGLHHILGLSMVIPMNVLYGDLWPYHELIFNLQICSVISLGIQQYGYTLDISTSWGLWKMQLYSLITWAGIVYSRIYRFIPLACTLLVTVREDGYTSFFFCACIALGAMSLTNLLYFLDATAKVLKFVLTKHDHQSTAISRAAFMGQIKAPSSV